MRVISQSCTEDSILHMSYNLGYMKNFNSIHKINTHLLYDTVNRTCVFCHIFSNKSLFRLGQNIKIYIEYGSQPHTPSGCAILNLGECTQLKDSDICTYVALGNIQVNYIGLHFPRTNT